MTDAKDSALQRPRPHAIEFRDTPEFTRSRAIRTGGPYDAESAVRTAKALRSQLALGEARRLAEYVRSPNGRQKVPLTDREDYQLLRVQVTCTYKDAELPPEVAFPTALALLKEAGFDPDAPATAAALALSGSYSEALGLAGAIWKRWWEYDGQRDRLTRSLSYYERAYGADVTTAGGYQAINAAYVLDLLGMLELGGGRAPDEVNSAAAEHFEAAEAIRAQLIAAGLTPSGNESAYWHYATLAEAHLGLGQTAEAQAMLTKALAEPAPDWEREATARQLAGLVRAQHARARTRGPVHASPLWQVVQQAYGQSLADGVRSALVGKVGLALSGGGFRAALYHIGVLARLAEVDVLRHVEVISCVSGGSIIGARYYLELRNLLQTKYDQDIEQKDYVDIVKRIETEFRKGVDTDLRNSLLADRATNLRTAREAAFTRTLRLGEMYEEALYKSVDDGAGSEPRYLDHLYVEPLFAEGERADPRPFNPRLENWKRRAKVPVLVINATSLNTGHAWQFTASWMGEPATYDQTVSATPPLRRIRYHEAPEQHRHIRLGHAVAASSCVPGMFEPVVLAGLYENGITVRLVDGGAFDNQGGAALLDENCSVLLVSDASGQIRLSDQPAGDPLAVALRANDVLMARVRETQFHLASRLRKAGVLRGLMYVHLRDGLATVPVNSIGSPDPLDLGIVREQRPMTDYGMRSDVQKRLAELRTDLDAFSELEASALMESGYLATKHHLPRSVPAALLGAEPATSIEWIFRNVEPLVATDDPQRNYGPVLQHLTLGSQLTGRTPRSRVLPRIPKGGALGFAFALGIVAVLGLSANWRATLVAIGILVVVVPIVAISVMSARGPARDRTAAWQRASGQFFGWLGWYWVRRELRDGKSKWLPAGKLEQFL